MIIKANKQIGFIYKNNESIDKIIKDGNVVFERGFLREKTSATLPITFGGVGKDLKDYRVYGNTYQNSTTGKNLRYIKDGTAAGVSLTYDNKSGKISIRGTATRTDGILLSEGGEVNIPAGTYTLSVSEPLPVLINSVVSLSSSTNVAFRMPAGNTSVTVNVSSDGVLVGLYFAVTKDVTYNFDFYLQLEKGSVVTEFEPFTNGASPNPGYPQEMVSCGDRTNNLLQLPDLANQTYRAIYTKIEDNSFKIEPDGTAGATGYARLDLTNLVKPNTTYTFSRTISKIGYNFINEGSARVDINGTLGNVIDTDSFNIVVPSTITRVWLYLYIAIDDNNLSSQTGSVTFNNVMLEENSTATSYEPYGYKIPVNVNNVITNIYLDEPLRKIDGYSDYIDFKNSKVVRQLGEVILDGSESWTTIQAYGRNYYAVAISNLLISNSGSNDALLYNNYYIGYKSNELVGNNTKDYGICRRNNNSQVLFRDKDQSILSDLTTWLSTNNNIMCYPLSTPTEESITLPNIATIDGNNTLNIETEITPSQVYIKYKSNE